MRCLASADIHYSLPQLDWLVQAAPGFDVVVLAGDLLDLGSLVEIDAQIVVAQAYLKRLAALTRVIVSSGNHDLDQRGPDGEKRAAWIVEAGAEEIAVDGGSLAAEDTLFTICPWWDGPLARDRLVRQLEADAVRRPKRWIWVHHAPPRNSPTSWSGSRTMGDETLVDWIEAYRPDMVLTGHIHQAPFVREGSWADRVGDTWVFNAGHQYGAPPAHVVFDTQEDAALWVSAMGAQSVRLGAPLVRPIPPLTALPGWLSDP
jgi:Icc-related predicted phosphoesterase